MTPLYLWIVFGSLLPSMLICWAAGWLCRRYGPQLGLVDQPGGRKIHQRPTPTAGGLAIWLGVVAPLALGQVCLWLLTGSDTTALPVSPTCRSSLPGGRCRAPCRSATGGTALALGPPSTPTLSVDLVQVDQCDTANWRQ